MAWWLPFVLIFERTNSAEWIFIAFLATVIMVAIGLGSPRKPRR
jgi:hypothetical protein